MNAIALTVRCLLNDSGVTGIVGTDVFPVAAPQNYIAPHCVVTLLHEDGDVTLNGHRAGFFARVSVQCMAPSAPEAITMGEAVKAALTLINEPVFSAAVPPVEIGTVTCWKEGTDITDYTPYRSIYRRVLDMRLRWTP